MYIRLFKSHLIRLLDFSCTKKIDATMGKLSQFIQQQTQLELGTENITVDSEPKVIKTLEELLEGLMVMPSQSQYPVTVAWPDGLESYNGEIDLLEACLNRAPDLAWYCHFLNLAKPYILERSKERRLGRSNDAQKIMGGSNEQLVSTQQTFIPV